VFSLNRVLVPRDETETTEKILAHCETSVFTCSQTLPFGTSKAKRIYLNLRYRRPSLMRLPSSPDITEVQSTGIACVFVNPAYAKYKYAKHMLSLLHYVQAKEEDLPSFPVGEWGEAPVVAEGWNRDVAFSVNLKSRLREATTWIADDDWCLLLGPVQRGREILLRLGSDG